MEAVKGIDGMWYAESTSYCQTEHGSVGSTTGCSTALLLSAPNKAQLCTCYDRDWLQEHVGCQLQ
jgi:hypothetical protein